MRQGEAARAVTESHFRCTGLLCCALLLALSPAARIISLAQLVNSRCGAATATLQRLLNKNAHDRISPPMGNTISVYLSRSCVNPLFYLFFILVSITDLPVSGRAERRALCHRKGHDAMSAPVHWLVIRCRSAHVCRARHLFSTGSLSESPCEKTQLPSFLPGRERLAPLLLGDLPPSGLFPISLSPQRGRSRSACSWSDRRSASRGPSLQDERRAASRERCDKMLSK